MEERQALSPACLSNDSHPADTLGNSHMNLPALNFREDIQEMIFNFRFQNEGKLSERPGFKLGTHKWGPVLHYLHRFDSVVVPTTGLLTFWLWG